MIDWNKLETSEDRNAKILRSFHDQVNSERDRRLKAGTIVSVTGFGDIPLQGRTEDQINLIGLKDTARDLLENGVDQPILPFRDANNVTHMLTPSQMVEMVDKGKVHVSDIYAKSWEIKQLSPIPDDVTKDELWV